MKTVFQRSSFPDARDEVRRVRHAITRVIYEHVAVTTYARYGLKRRSDRNTPVASLSSCSDQTSHEFGRYIIMSRYKRARLPSCLDLIAYANSSFVSFS